MTQQMKRPYEVSGEGFGIILRTENLSALLMAGRLPGTGERRDGLADEEMEGAEVRKGASNIQISSHEEGLQA